MASSRTPKKCRRTPNPRTWEDAGGRRPRLRLQYSWDPPRSDKSLEFFRSKWNPPTSSSASQWRRRDMGQVTWNQGRWICWSLFLCLRSANPEKNGGTPISTKYEISCCNLLAIGNLWKPSKSVGVVTNSCSNLNWPKLNWGIASYSAVSWFLPKLGLSSGTPWTPYTTNRQLADQVTYVTCLQTAFAKFSHVLLVNNGTVNIKIKSIQTGRTQQPIELPSLEFRGTLMQLPGCSARRKLCAARSRNSPRSEWLGPTVRLCCTYQITILYHHCDYHHIISYHIISYHIISYHIISHHITSHHMISYHITSHHITSHHITSYHIHLQSGGHKCGLRTFESVEKPKVDKSRKLFTLKLKTANIDAGFPVKCVNMHVFSCFWKTRILETVQCVFDWKTCSFQDAKFLELCCIVSFSSRKSLASFKDEMFSLKMQGHCHCFFKDVWLQTVLFAGRVLELVSFLKNSWRMQEFWKIPAMICVTIKSEIKAIFLQKGTFKEIWWELVRYTWNFGLWQAKFWICTAIVKKCICAYSHYLALRPQLNVYLNQKAISLPWTVADKSRYWAGSICKYESNMHRLERREGQSCRQTVGQRWLGWG